MRRRIEGAQRGPTGCMVLCIVVAAVLSASTISASVNRWRLDGLALSLRQAGCTLDTSTVLSQQGFRSVGFSGAHLGFFVADLRTYRGTPDELFAAYGVSPEVVDLPPLPHQPQVAYSSRMVSYPWGRQANLCLIVLEPGWTTTRLADACAWAHFVPPYRPEAMFQRDPQGRSCYIVYAAAAEPIRLDLWNGDW